MLRLMTETWIDAQMFDSVFAGGAVTEQRLEEASVLVMQLAQRNKDAAQSAERLLARIVLSAIADGLCAKPQECAATYFELMRAAFGEPTLLDSVKDRLLGQDRTE